MFERNKDHCFGKTLFITQALNTHAMHIDQTPLLSGCVLLSPSKSPPRENISSQEDACAPVVRPANAVMPDPVENFSISLAILACISC